MQKKLHILCLIVGFLLAFQVQAQRALTPNKGKDNPNKNNASVTIKPKTYLQVEGRSGEINLDLSDLGGNETLSISTNSAKTPVVSGLPDWINVVSISKKELIIDYQANNTVWNRSWIFYIDAGNLHVKVNVIQPGGKPKITGIKIANAYGSIMYASDVMGLVSTLTYDYSGSPKNKEVYVKLFDPNRSLLHKNSSPSGYTYCQNVSFSPGKDITLEIGKWRDKYKPGEYVMEVYIDNEKAISGSVVLLKKDNESTYLGVSETGKIISYNQDKLHSAFNYKGDKNKTFNVSTNGSEWELSPGPYFCHLVEKTDNSFTIKCDYNMGKSRSGSFEVKTANQTFQINIEQGEGTGGRINKVWTDHNIYENGMKGMRIHIEFETLGLKGHVLRPCVFFYYKDNRVIKGSQNKYMTPDGQATIQDQCTSTFENSIWKDYTLFIPYSAMDIPSGNNDCKFYVVIYDNGLRRAESDYYHFNFSR